MQIACHLGAPCTDNDALLWSLRRDDEALAKDGICVPRPRRFRRQVGEVTTRLRGSRLDSTHQDQLVKFITSGADTQRLVLSDHRFICMPSRIFFDGGFYTKAGYKTAWLREAFADHEVSFFLAIRNPAGFLSDLLPACEAHTYQTLLNGADPMKIRWSEVVERIRADNPSAPLTVWCHEDAPLIWPQILRAVAGANPAQALSGSHELANGLMDEDGAQKLEAHLAAHPPETDAQRSVAISEHLEKYAREDAMEDEIDLPGWTEDVVDQITADYDADVTRIREIHGVTLLRP